MYLIKRLLTLFYLILILFPAISQDKDPFYLVDTSNFHQLTPKERTLLDTSLPKVHEAKTDSAKVALLYNMFMYMNDNDVWIKYNDLALDMVRNRGVKEKHPQFALNTEISCLNNKAYYSSYKGNTEKVLDEYKKVLELSRKHENKKGVAAALLNIGNVVHRVGNIKLAMEHYQESHKIAEEIDNAYYLCITANNIGDLLISQGNPSLALDHLKIALEEGKKANFSSGIGKTYYNMGRAFHRLEDSEMARTYYDSSEAIFKKTQNLSGIAKLKIWLGQDFFQKGIPDSGFYYYREAKGLHEKVGDHKALIGNLYKLGMAHLEWGSLDSAHYYLKRSYDASRELNSPYHIKNASKGLYYFYKRKKDYRNALTYHEYFTKNKDSIYNENSRKNVLKQQFQYQNEKRELADSLEYAKKEELKNVKIEKQKAQLDQERTQRYALYGGLGFVLVIALLIFRGFQQKKKDNRVISAQKEEVEDQRDEAARQKSVAEEKQAIVEEQNKEILASISYAKRLQDAILPPKRLVREWLPGSFILYKPKDIVAGDFYWMENLGKTVYFAAADCTGHGVPGAMVSVICSNALSKALFEENILEPAKILDRVRELVIEKFERSEKEVKDGMDISLCAWNPQSGELKWAGANNPLWIVGGSHLNDLSYKTHSPEGSGLSLYEVKPDKQPIGKFDSMTPFTGHTLQLKEGDTIYIFSDGFIDQFGGPKGKKYKSLPFKNYLISINDKPMNEQRELLDREFEEWKGEVQQIDDVCVIGMRVISE